MECNICSQNHKELHRTGLLNMRGSEDDYICNTCKSLIAKFARSLKQVADLVRYSEMIKAEVSRLFGLSDILALEYMQDRGMEHPLLPKVIHLNYEWSKNGKDPGDCKEYYNLKIKMLNDLGIKIKE